MRDNASMLNPHFQKLQTAYIFPIIERKLLELQKDHPNQKIFNLGVGDISLPLLPEIAKAISDATYQMTQEPIGYGPCGGYPFLKEIICHNEYAPFGVTPDEIFISDGTNTDASSIQELFDQQTTVLVTEPTYPVYRDANLIAGKKVEFLQLTEKEGFIPRPPKERADLVYLCTPCNPTGVTMNREELSHWIDWARQNKSILVLDNVYNAFISSEDIPSSIYALEGAKEVAIELRSFSKWAGFTGLRCSYMIIPKQLHLEQLNQLWAKRMDIKTNGISYPIQKGAAVCYDKSVKEKLQNQVAMYQKSSIILRETLHTLDQTFFGGEHSPYIWWKTPSQKNSWEFFDELLEGSRIISIPGSGFGKQGEGYVRLSCFVSPSLAQEAAYALQHHFAAV